MVERLAEVKKGLAIAFALSMGLIASFEGYSHRAYLDPIGIPTICQGHTEGVKIGDTATDEDCKEMTQEDFRKVAAQLDGIVVPAPIWGAFADFCYNVGVTRCKSSTLYTYLKAGQYRKACDEFPKWIYAHGKPLSGLIRRRQAERDLCMKGVK